MRSTTCVDPHLDASLMDRGNVPPQTGIWTSLQRAAVSKPATYSIPYRYPKIALHGYLLP